MSPKKRKLGEVAPSQAYCFTAGLITRKDCIKDKANVVQVNCAICIAVWYIRDSTQYNSTSNYKRHFQKKHPDIPFEDPEAETPSTKKGKFQTSINIFIASANLL